MKRVARRLPTRGVSPTASPASLIAAGLFVAEGRLVVERLLRRARFAIHSVLVTPPRSTR